MKIWNVYQPLISDARYAEVREMQWDGVAWGKAYSDVTLLHNADKAHAAMAEAVDHDLYRHAYIVECPDVDGTFTLTNGFGDGAPNRVIHKALRAKSGSVGDVVIAADCSEGWICLGCGWAEMTPYAIRWFEAKVTTVIVANA